MKISDDIYFRVGVVNFVVNCGLAISLLASLKDVPPSSPSDASASDVTGKKFLNVPPHLKDNPHKPRDRTKHTNHIRLSPISDNERTQLFTADGKLRTEICRYFGLDEAAKNRLEVEIALIIKSIQKDEVKRAKLMKNKSGEDVIVVQADPNFHSEITKQIEKCLLHEMDRPDIPALAAAIATEAPFSRPCFTFHVAEWVNGDNGGTESRIAVNYFKPGSDDSTSFTASDAYNRSSKYWHLFDSLKEIVSKQSAE